MEQKPVELPSLDELKELLKDTKNIIFYKRAEVIGSQESLNYLHRKIEELEILMDTGEDEKKDEKIVGI